MRLLHWILDQLPVTRASVRELEAENRDLMEIVHIFDRDDAVVHLLTHTQALLLETAQKLQGSDERREEADITIALLEQKVNTATDLLDRSVAEIGEQARRSADRQRVLDDYIDHEYDISTDRGDAAEDRIFEEAEAGRNGW